MKSHCRHHPHSARLASVVGIACWLTLFVGCGPKSVQTAIRGERTLVEATADQPPRWVVREPESDGTFHYFRGFRSDAPTLEAGETDARQNALAHIIQFLGLRVTVDYERVRTEDETRIRDAIRSVGGADIFGTRLNELYYRRWRVRDADRVREAYDVYVLIRFPAEAVERIKQNQVERLRSIRQMMSGPGFMARPGEVYSQIVQSAQALAALDELNQSVLVTTETEGEADQLRRQAAARLIRLIGRLHLAVKTSEIKAASGSQKTPFIVSVHVTADDRGTPAPNVPVSVSVGDSSRVIWSDDRGVAEWPLYTVAFPVGEQPITARLELPNGLRSNGDFARAVPVANGTLRVVPATSLAVLFVVIDERLGTIPYDEHTAEGRLVAALKVQGFQVISPSALPPESMAGDPWARESDAISLGRQAGATILVRGTMTTDEPTPVSRMEGVFFCRAQVRLVLTDLADGRVLDSIVLPDDVVTDTRGFGNSPERAGREALTLNRRQQPNGFVHIAERVAEVVHR